jgi:hypothetical protein
MLREFSVLPCLTLLFPMLVFHRGSDAFNLCMNTVAVLFVLDIDNIIYNHGVPDKISQEFEAHHHLLLDEREHGMLEKTKSVYMIVLPAYLIYTMLTFPTAISCTFDTAEVLMRDLAALPLVIWVLEQFLHAKPQWGGRKCGLLRRTIKTLVKIALMWVMNGGLALWFRGW